MNAADWLRERVAGAPPALLDEMLAALPTGPMPIPQALAEGALTLFARVARGTGGREDALPLLAADALLTHALQAHAEQDVAGLPAFCRAWGAQGRLGELASRVTP